MLETCVACKSFEIVFGARLCGECLDAGKTFCAYCTRIFQQGVMSPACVAGHQHHWCDDCAEAWSGLCPESDESQVAKVVMG